MGGVAGHMQHLYENYELTFKELIEVLTAASAGELEGTEKTDGQNLFISYSVQNGSARAARNKGNIKSGGLSVEDIINKFTDHPNPQLQKAFGDAFRTFEKAVRSLDPETQMAIFGPDANIYYNAEVQDPRTPNIINYDTKTLNIHQVGHAQFDKETGTIKDVDVSKNVRALDKALKQMQSAVEDEDYSLQRNAIVNLRALSNDVALDSAVDQIQQMVNTVGISDNQTIADFIIARITPFIESRVDLPDKHMKLLIKRLFKVPGVTFNNIVKGLDREDKEKVRQVVKSEKTLMKNAILPLEEIIHDFSVEMLRGLHSAFILDNPKEVMRLRQELQKAIIAIEGSNDETAMKVLQQQMAKLKKLENVSTAVEGFVFDYGGQTYKFTGNFAPMNQILGLFRYGRGGKPLNLTEEEEEVKDYETDVNNDTTIALVPGGFKPPHRGHLDMVKSVANNDRILIIMGSGGDSPRMIGDTIVNYNTAMIIWGMILEDAGITNYDFVEVVEGELNHEGTKSATPLSKAFDILQYYSSPGQTYSMLTSEKDAGRFGEEVRKYAPEGVNVRVVETPVTQASTGEQLSARFLRQFIVNNNYEEFLEYMPAETIKSGNAEEIFAMLGGKKKEMVAESLLDMVEYLLDEGDYQKSPTKKNYLKSWHKMLSTGKQKPGPPYTKKRPKKVGPAPVGFGAFEEEGKKSKKYFGKEFYDIELLHGDELGEQCAGPGAIPPAPESGDIEGAYTKSPFPGVKRRKHKKRKRDETSAMGLGSVGIAAAKPKRKVRKMQEDTEFIDEVMNYLLKVIGETE